MAAGCSDTHPGAWALRYAWMLSLADDKVRSMTACICIAWAEEVHRYYYPPKVCISHALEDCNLSSPHSRYLLFTYIPQHAVHAA